ncbi:hypothetical protein [Arthrobacter wenxiniae]|uniref:Uncharacterized protein n=1 Tax=Arthrobacter wenxiniae TaxID=2713570 RepID=A0A7Y7IIH1_9MICC|nr:hypothetical protein [Arthrobacter wenxiniae]NVM96109.1 hypothetical protein [Arthrobacter wenxiniae]
MNIITPGGNFMKRIITASLISSALLAVSLTGCGSSGNASAPAGGAGTFTAKALLRDQTVPRWAEGENCDTGNVEQLGEGFEVRIKAKGETVAMGKLSHGVMAPRASNGYFCDYQMSIDGVPAGLKFYTIELGDKLGHHEMSEQDIQAGLELRTSTFEGFN